MEFISLSIVPGYIVLFLILSSILIDLFFSYLFIGSIFSTHNYWYLLSYSNQFTLHYSTFYLLLVIITCWFISYYLLVYYQLYFTLHQTILYSIFSNPTFFIPVFIDFFLINTIYFFKTLINSIEAVNGVNVSTSILPVRFLSMFIWTELMVCFILWSFT